MSIALLIATSFSLGFFVESIIGFGGGLIAYSILGFFLDLKEMILAGLYISTCASAYIAYTDLKSFDKKVFKPVVPVCLLGTILGVFVFTYFSSTILSVIFGILLILLAIKTIFFDKFIFPKVFKTKLLFIGGISQGAFGIGGPFVVNALKNDFENKSALRTTMAVFFMFFNLVRFVQLSLQGQIDPAFFGKIWWTIIPVFLAIQLGYRIHLKISEDLFKKMIGLMTIFAGLKFLAKVF
ncbi:MAG: sulfite exporter TauE/SafE family protein [Pseudomonadota bacterium]